jgi:hypothetical protein
VRRDCRRQHGDVLQALVRPVGYELVVIFGIGRNFRTKLDQGSNINLKFMIYLLSGY